jgi:alpha-tubulin suppressor-like RCC1 family protein
VLLLLSHGISLAEPPAGSMVAWGDNYWGQMNVPAPNSAFVAVAAGGLHSLGLRSDGTIVAWGCSSPFDHGQCNVPTPNSGFVAVAAGDLHSLAIKSDGSIVAWGDNDYGQTNLKSDGSIVAWGYNYYRQTTVPAPNSDFVALAGGGYHSLGIRGSKADYDDDGNIDATDYAVLWSVIDSEDRGGPGVEPTVRFWYLFDMDSDRDVDLQDFALFANAFTGE